MGEPHDLEQHPTPSHAQAVLECTEDAVITSDAGHRISGWNRAAAQIYGWSMDEVRGRHLSQVLQPRWPSPEAREASLEAMDRDGRWEGEVVHLHRDGRPLHIHVRVRLLRAWDGEIHGAVTVAHDLTRQRAAEEGLAQAHSRLAEVQRTDALGQLAGSVAHDFNNLLAILGGNAELALSELPPGHRAQRFLEMISGAVERGAVLTRQLLSFGRRDQLDVQTIDLAEVVLGIDEVLRRLVGAQHQLVLELPDQPVYVRASTGELQQVLINLCGNAREAMPRPGTIRVRVEQRSPNIAEIVVLDDGEGMPPEIAARATEPFFTTRAPGRGTGLGLAVVTRVATRYGGELVLDSAVGVGTRVAIRLPVAVETRAAPVTPALTTTLSVLYAEDDDLVRDVMTEMLGLLGHKVLAVSDGDEAIATARSTTFDIFITDVAMARVNGPDAASALRLARPRLPIVYVSGFPRGEGDLEGWPEGVWRMKPVSLDQLRSAIAEAIAGR